MPFCKFSSELVFSNSTKVDNVFIETYLPSAPADFVKVYLYGLYKCGHSESADNTLESFSKILKLSEDEIIEAYRYFESENLVVILNIDPIEVKYLEPKHTIENFKKRDVDKYHNFNLQMQAVIEGRMISSNEYVKYYVCMESLHIEETAFIMIAKYCTNLKGTNINAEYIVKVATAWAYDGIKTVQAADAKIKESESMYGKLKDVLAALEINKPASLEEREMFNDWKKKLGFDYDLIYYTAKNMKGKKSFNKLNSKLNKYAELKLYSIKETEDYEEQSKQHKDLTMEIVKNLALYYENLETPTEVYIVKWLAEGFSESMLVEVSKLCFKKNMKSLEQMDQYIDSLYKMNILTLDSFMQYMHNILATDKEIKEILDALGIIRGVNTTDRSFYHTWSYTWKFTFETILYVAKSCFNTINALQNLNRTLSNLKDKNILNLTEVQKQDLNSFTVKEKVNKNKALEYDQHTYTKEEADAVFSNLDEFLNKYN